MAAMNRKICFCLLVLSFGCLSSASAENVNELLSQEYKNHVLPLRYPFTHGVQKFDSSGRPLAAPTGPWLVYGGIYIRDVKLSQDALQIEGPRIAFLVSPEISASAVILQKTVKVQIHLNRPLASVTEAQELLDHIFYLNPGDLSHARPEYRRSDYHPEGAAAPLEFSNVTKDGVKPPKAVNTPEPNYSEEARHARYQGNVMMRIVIDTSGSVTDIRIERALGKGLDENAVEAVKKWKFSPATRDGQPVSVSMMTEISFNLR